MADEIKITCEHCNHVVKAPHAAAGKRGKCPHCHNSIYVPTPESELDVIPLVPVDESAENLSERLRNESYRIASALRHERDSEAGVTQSGKAPEKPAVRRPPSVNIKIPETILEYLQAMKSSDLELAERITQTLRSVAPQAKSKVQQMMVDSMLPSSVRDLPPALYQGFLKKLLEELQ